MSWYYRTHGQSRRSGVASLVQSAVDKRADPEARFLLDGDLNQMSVQKDLLMEHGIEVFRWDAYPAVRSEEDFKKALQLFWDRRVEGWWNYEEELVKHGICVQEEYDTKLGRKR